MVFEKAYCSVYLFCKWRADLTKPLSNNKIRRNSLQRIFIYFVNVFSRVHKLNYLVIYLPPCHLTWIKRGPYDSWFFPCLRRIFAFVCDTHYLASCTEFI